MWLLGVVVLGRLVECAFLSWFFLFYVRHFHVERDERLAVLHRWVDSEVELYSIAGKCRLRLHSSCRLCCPVTCDQAFFFFF